MRFLFLLIFMLLPLDAVAQSDTSTPTDGAVIEVGQDQPSDADITKRIREILGEFEKFDGVQISVISGVVSAQGEVATNDALVELGEIISRVEGVVAQNISVTETTDLAEQLVPAAERLKERAASLTGKLPLLLVAITVFGVIAGLGFLLTRSRVFWDRIAPNPFIADIYKVIARLAFVVVGIVIALDILNATTLIGAVLGTAGVVGLAVGFAVRDTVENFIASILLSLRRPFQPNDYVEIDGIGGTVSRLTSRATILISPDGNHIRIPNANVFKGTIINYSTNPHRRFDFELGVESESDLGGALAVASEAINDLGYVLSTPAPSAYIQSVGDSNIVLQFQGWIDQRDTDFLKARGEAIRVSKAALEDAGFGLPEPIYRLRVEGKGGVLSEALTDAPEPKAAPYQSEPPEAADPTTKVLDIEQAAAEERDKPGQEDLLRHGTETE